MNFWHKYYKMLVNFIKHPMVWVVLTLVTTIISYIYGCPKVSSAITTFSAMIVAWATIQLAFYAKETIVANLNATIMTERPYLFFDSFSITTNPYTFFIKNNGRTPATSIDINYNYKICDNVLYDFEPPYDKLRFQHYNSFAPEQLFPLEVDEKMKEELNWNSVNLNSGKASNLFLWGCIEYRDTFNNTNRYYTKFLYKISCQLNPHTSELEVKSIPFGKYNLIGNSIWNQ